MILYHQYRPKPTHQQTVGQKIDHQKLGTKAIFISAREWNQHDFVNTFETRQNIRKKRDDSPDTNTSKTLRYQNRSNFPTSSFNRMLKIISDWLLTVKKFKLVNIIIIIRKKLFGHTPDFLMVQKHCKIAASCGSSISQSRIFKRRFMILKSALVSS